MKGILEGIKPVSIQQNSLGISTSLFENTTELSSFCTYDFRLHTNFPASVSQKRTSLNRTAQRCEGSRPSFIFLEGQSVLPVAESSAVLATGHHFLLLQPYLSLGFCHIVLSQFHSYFLIFHLSFLHWAQTAVLGNGIPSKIIQSFI